MARNAEKDGFSHVFRILTRIFVFLRCGDWSFQIYLFSLENLFYFVENFMTKRQDCMWVNCFKSLIATGFMAKNVKGVCIQIM